jgi:transposase
MSCEAIAEVLYLDDDTIRTSHRLYQDEGLAGFGHEGSACRLSDVQQDKLTAWITETLPRTTLEVGAWIETERGVTYESRSGLIALLHRLDMGHHKPKAVSSKLDPDKQAAFIKAYENLLNQIGDDEAVLFGDAVHPTHAVRPGGCWAPKDTPVAVEQRRPETTEHSRCDRSQDRQNPYDRGGNGECDQHDHVAAGDRGNVSGQAVDPSVCGQRPLPLRQTGAGLAGPAGLPGQTALHPDLLPASGSR